MLNKWVIQILGGKFFAYGPFKSEGAWDKRFNSTKGGEVHKFECWADTEEDVIKDFKQSLARSL